MQRTMRDSVQQDIDRADKRLFGLKHMLGKWLVWDRDSLERRGKDKSGELKEVVEQQEKMRKQAAREAEEEEVRIRPCPCPSRGENDARRLMHVILTEPMSTLDMISTPRRSCAAAWRSWRRARRR